MPIKKIEAGRVITQTIDTFIGIEGTIFYDEKTGELRLSDGETPGGFSIGGGGSGYILPKASDTRLGGIKVGNELSIDNTGTLNVDLSAVSQSIIPATDKEYSLGAIGYRWKDIFVSTGSVYIGDLRLSNNNGTLLLGDPTSVDIDPHTIIRGERDVDDYASISIRNLNTGTRASADLILYQGGSTQDHYADLGIASDNYSYSGFSLIEPGDTYLFGQGGNVKIGTASSGTDVVFFTGGTDNASNEVARFKDGIGLVLKGSLVFADGSTMSTAASGNSSGTVSVTVVPNSGLAVTDNVLSTVYNSAISDDVQSIAVGGAASALASVWKNKNIVEVLDTILFPDVLPTYTVPTLSASGPQSGTKEIGSTVAQSLTLVGVEGDAGIFTALSLSRGGTQLSAVANPTVYSFTDVAAQFGYVDDNNPNYSYSLTYTDNFVVVSGNTSWSGAGTYSAGVAKKNNKGVTDVRTAQVRSTIAPQSASSIGSNSITVTGIYPYFWGKSSTLPTAVSIAAAILAGSTNKVLSDASGTVSVTFAAAGQYVWMAHAASYTSKTKWFNTQLNQGSIGAGNFILSPVTQSVGSPDGFWTGVSYKVYISSGATNTDGAIEFRNA